MLILFEKGIRGGMCQASYMLEMLKQTINTSRTMIKIKNHHS